MLTTPPGNAGEGRRGLLVFGAATLRSVSHYRKLFMGAKDNQKLAGDSEIRAGGQEGVEPDVLKVSEP